MPFSTVKYLIDKNKSLWRVVEMPWKRQVPIKYSSTLILYNRTNKNESIFLTFTEGLGGKLCMIDYGISFSENAEPYFNHLRETLVSKYGEPKLAGNTTAQWIIDENIQIWFGMVQKDDLYNVRLTYFHHSMMMASKKYSEQKFQMLKEQYYKEMRNQF